VYGKVILTLLGDRAVIDVLVGVIAGVRRRIAEPAERDEKPLRRKNRAVYEIGSALAQAFLQPSEVFVAV
jgi:hypothetical protein